MVQDKSVFSFQGYEPLPGIGAGSDAAIARCCRVTVSIKAADVHLPFGADHQAGAEREVDLVLASPVLLALPAVHKIHDVIKALKICKDPEVFHDGL